MKYKMNNSTPYHAGDAIPMAQNNVDDDDDAATHCVPVPICHPIEINVVAIYMKPNDR